MKLERESACMTDALSVLSITTGFLMDQVNARRGMGLTDAVVLATVTQAKSRGSPR